MNMNVNMNMIKIGKTRALSRRRRTGDMIPSRLLRIPVPVRVRVRVPILSRSITLREWMGTAARLVPSRGYSSAAAAAVVADG